MLLLEGSHLWVEGLSFQEKLTRGREILTRRGLGELRGSASQMQEGDQESIWYRDSLVFPFVKLHRVPQPHVVSLVQQINRLQNAGSRSGARIERGGDGGV